MSASQTVDLTLRYEEACELFHCLGWERPRVNQHEVSCTIPVRRVPVLEARLQERLQSAQIFLGERHLRYSRGERACRAVHIERLIQRLQRLQRVG